MMEKIAVSVEEAAKMIGVSRANMYNIIHQAGFPVRQIGGRYLISVKALERWLENAD